MRIQPKKQGSNTKELLLSGDTSTQPILYNQFEIELVDEVDENLEEAKVYLPNSSEFNYYIYEYTAPFVTSGNTVTNLVESGLIQVGNTQPSPINIGGDTTNENIIL